MAVNKFPPPPQLPREFGAFGQQLNRWLIEVQNILNSGGLIEPDSVVGLPGLFTHVDALQGEVTTLQGQVTTLEGEVTTLQGQVTTLEGEVTTLQGQVTTLQGEVTALLARNQILNGAGVPGAGLGSDGDLYINNTGSAGTNLYAKIAGAWIAFA